MLEKYLIEHCSPTLASIKTGCLFSFAYSDESELESSLHDWNLYFKDEGISLLLLRKNNGRALIYVFRKNLLQDDLNKAGVSRFLKSCGYSDTNIDSALDMLKSRLNQADGFPHEIGIFLGYPLGDVIGFIQNSGRNSKCSGCWKVYCNECEAIKTFALYKKCKDVYMRLWLNGRTVRQLTVAS